MAKFDPYQPKEITLKIKSASTGEVHDEITGTIQKISWKMYRNGYSNWDGSYYIPAYRFTYTRRDGEEVVIEDSQRKGVISEAIVRHGDSIGLDYQEKMDLDRKGK